MPKKRKLLIAVFIIFCIPLILIAYLYLFLPYSDYPQFDTTNSNELIERGAYLANHVAVCVDCHSTRDWRYYAGPIRPGTEGMGGERFDRGLGFPGVFVSKNITPAGIGDWSDRELARSIVTGVSRDGRPFFPVMPYPAYANLSVADLTALVAYIRTLKPIPNEVPAAEVDFPMNFILRTIPGPARPASVDPADTVAYGEYLTTIGGCAECHTPANKGTKLPGMYLAGGFAFPFPDGSVVRSSNITPDDATGIGKWSREQFIARFKSSDTPAARLIRVKPGEMNTYMPWIMYAGMSAADLGAIYDYLRTIPAVSNPVEKFTPATAESESP
ncbi:MAG: cytochrome C [Leptospiraceae bacterium]|nr:cytochrome C [Leptospiraceae bacterium]